LREQIKNPITSQSMKHINILPLTCFIFLALALGACKDEKQVSYMPTWHGFIYTPKPLVLGDSVTIEAQQQEIGHLIYKAVYSWTATYTIPKDDGADSTVTDKKSQTVVYDNDPSNPTVRFHVPGNITSRNFMVTFRGEYHYSATGAQGSDGSIVGEGTFGSLHRGQSSALYGYSNGTLTIPVN